MLTGIEESPNFNIQDKQMSTAILLPKEVENALSVIDNQQYFKNSSIKKTITRCNQIYRDEGTPASGIDLLIDLAVTDCYPQKAETKKLNQIIEHFNSWVNYGYPNVSHGLYHINKEAAMEFFVGGNGFPYSLWESGVKIFDSSVTAEIPTGILFLDPQAIYMQAGKNIGQKEFHYSSKGKMDLPQKDGKWVLNNENIYHIKRRSRDYEDWGLPYLTKCFPAISKIKRLRKMEEAIVDGIIHLITVFKIGTEEHPASPARIAAFRNMVSNPSHSMSLVWGHDFSHEMIAPDGKLLAMEENYKAAYDELLRALGIPHAVFAEGSLRKEHFIILLKRVNEYREVFKTYMSRIYRQIAERNNIKEFIQMEMDPIRIDDDLTVKRLILDMYDRGLLDYENAVNQAGYNFQDVLEKKILHKDKAETFAPPILPFSNNDNKQGNRNEQTYDSQSNK